MTIKEFLQWVTEHKDYAPLYSSLIATGALLFSVLSFIISNIVSKIVPKEIKSFLMQDMKNKENNMKND